MGGLNIIHVILVISTGLISLILNTIHFENENQFPLRHDVFVFRIIINKLPINSQNKTTVYNWFSFMCDRDRTNRS